MRQIYHIFYLPLFIGVFNSATISEKKDVTIIKDSLIYFCKLQLGSKYNFATCTPQSGFDCSGFVYYVFQHFKVSVPRSSTDFINFGEIVSLDSCKTGDVIVFTGTDFTKGTPGHVGIILNEKGKAVSFIHSSSDKRTPGVKISNFNDSPNYKKRFLKITRVCKVI